MSSPQIPAEVVIYDLEYTAWEGSLAERWLKPGQYREVVQIGAVRLDALSLEEDGAFEVLVKPRLNPVLSPYFEKLTGITNAKLGRRGMDFGEAFASFQAFARGLPMFSFGRDELIYDDNFRLYGIAPPVISARYENIAPWLRANGLHPRHAGDVAEAAGAPFPGQKHDALYDARSVARGVKALVERGAENPFASLPRAQSRSATR